MMKMLPKTEESPNTSWLLFLQRLDFLIKIRITVCRGGPLFLNREGVEELWERILTFWLLKDRGTKITHISGRGYEGG